MISLGLFDFIVAPLYILFIFFIALLIKNKYIKTNSTYTYFIPGLLAKIVGGIAVCLIYIYYYKGGDTINYYITSNSFSNLLSVNPRNFLNVWLGFVKNYQLIYYFNNDVGFPAFSPYDNYALFVVRLIVPLYFISFGSYITMTILLASICYTGIWKLYQVFCMEFPQIQKELAIAILFVPSVVFWGSGLLKDTVTLAAAGWFTYSFYHLFILRKKRILNTITIVLSSFLLLSIKPYILLALIPGSFIWFFTKQSKEIKSPILKFISLPLFLTVALLSAYLIIGQLQLGSYSIENALEKAVISQQDLKRDAYKGNSFDIGNFDASIGGIIIKAPLAINAALYRPYIWETRNVVMFLSGIENSLILFLSIYLLIRLKVINFFRLIGKHPLLLFSFLFAIFFAFSVGISISNFGSLVRLKIPAIPFFVASLFIINHFYKIKKEALL